MEMEPQEKKTQPLPIHHENGLGGEATDEEGPEAECGEGQDEKAWNPGKKLAAGGPGQGGGERGQDSGEEPEGEEGSPHELE